MTALIDPIHNPMAEDGAHVFPDQPRVPAGNPAGGTPRGGRQRSSGPDTSWRVADRGVSALTGPELEALVDAAHRAGAPRVLIEIVTDPAAPYVARQRAFGRIEMAIAAGRRPQSGHR